ncbi:MAG: Gfo/Idh/MocA family oxidoreductase, partial [Limisphaerales bacterium]
MNTQFSRRKFLRTSMALGAALAAPTIIPASALGRNGTKAPSERINMGFIGLGGQGSGHLLGGAWTYMPGGYSSDPRVQVLAVCDVDTNRREKAHKRCNESYAKRLGQADYNGVKAYNDFREVLARTDIDAVLLALPYHWSAPMAAMAMEAGKDVYCEKPIAITVREGLNMVAASKRYARIYQAGTQQRSEYDGKFRKACEYIRSGRIGQLKEVYAYRSPGAFWPKHWTAAEKGQPVPAGLDWNMWVGPLPWQPFPGKLPGQEIHSLITGDVNWAPHHYDVIQWMVNPDVTAPIKVWPENDAIHWRYNNGVVVHSNGYQDEKVGAIGGGVFVGTEGRIAVDREKLISYPGKILEEPLKASDAKVYHAESHSGNFLECVRSRKPTICDPDTALYSINAVLIGGIALILQRALEWDPVK